jgi:hypothetical protein
VFSDAAHAESNRFYLLVRGGSGGGGTSAGAVVGAVIGAAVAVAAVCGIAFLIYKKKQKYGEAEGASESRRLAGLPRVREKGSDDG